MYLSQRDCCVWLLGITCLLAWLPPAIPGGRKRGSVPLPCPSPTCHCRRVQGEVVLRCSRTAGQLPHFDLHENITYRLVELVEQNLTQIPKGAFKNVPTRALDLSGNALYGGLPVGVFDGQEDSMKTLTLSDSLLPEVPSLLNLTTLGTLKLDGNNISAIPAGTFSGAVYLKELHLYRNVIVWIEHGAFNGLQRLEHLKLFDNQLVEIPRKLFRGLRTLVSLDISRNKLTSLLSGTFKGLASLKWLILESNHLTSISRQSFKGLPSLRYLKLENNPLESIGDGTFLVIRRISYLSIDIANLTDLSADTFEGLAKLKTLNLGEINRSSLPERLFGSMDNLQYLSILDYEQRLFNLSSTTFSDKMHFSQLKVWIVPVYECRCDLPWISDLTQKGAYLHGYCGKGQPISCVRRQKPNTRRRRLKRKKGKNT